MESNIPRQSIGKLDLEKGFLPLFSQSFIEHYGLFSLFVRAVSDSFTNATVKVLVAGDHPVPENIANYAPVEATKAVDVLMISLSSVHGRSAGQALLHESTRFAPIGSFSDFVDSTYGAGCFNNWVSALEATQYEEACQAVPKRASDEES